MATTSADATTQLAARLRVAVARTSRRLRQEAGGELTPSLTAALATVERHGPLTPSEIAERERVKRPTATRYVANLEARGLVARTADPADGRSSLIAITKPGLALLESQRGRKTAFLSRHLATLDSHDRAAVERTVDLLESLLEDARR